MSGIERAEFFGRPGDQVATDMSEGWVHHPDRQEVFPGQAAIIGLETGQGTRMFRLDHSIYYDDAYTKQRWPNSRGPELATMAPGEVIGYKFHQTVLTFIKVGPVGDSSNIQLSTLTEVDRQGAPVLGGESQLKPGKIAELLGLDHQTRGQITPFNFRHTPGFLISVGDRELTPEEIQSIEDEILGS